MSQPVAIRLEDHGVRIERVRRMTSRPTAATVHAGRRSSSPTVTPAQLAEEAAAHGLEAEALRRIPETAEHVGSEVVMLRA